MPAHLLRTAPHVGSGDEGLAGVGRQQGGQDPQRRGLPGPVGSEEPEYLPGRDGEVDPADRRHRLVLDAECLAQAAGPDRVGW